MEAAVSPAIGTSTPTAMKRWSKQVISGRDAGWRLPSREWGSCLVGGALLGMLTACGSLPTATGSLPIPPELDVVTATSTPLASPLALETPWVLTSQQRASLNIPDDQMVILVEQQGSDLVAQMPEAEVARWLADTLGTGVEGIDLSLAVGSYRQTASALLRPGQSALFTFANPPQGEAILTATAFVGIDTLATGELSLTLGETNATSSNRWLPLVLAEVNVPLLQGLTIGVESLPLLAGRGEIPLVASEAWDLVGQNLDQVTAVRLASSGDPPASATILNQTPTRLTIATPTGLSGEISLLAVNEQGIGLGRLFLNWPGIPTPTSSPAPASQPSREWRVQTLTLPTDPQQPQLQNPSAVVGDATGNLFIADADQHQIFRLTVAGDLTVWAGSGEAGWRDGNGSEAQFSSPSDLFLDNEGILWVADRGNHRIRRITTDRQVSTWAGSGQAGWQDGWGRSARFRDPVALTHGEDGTLYVADQGNHRIRQISPAGEVSTWAGTGEAGWRDGEGKEAQFDRPTDLVLAPDQSLWVADQGNHRIRQITPSGEVITLAGDTPGSIDGEGSVALLDHPTGLSLDTQGNLLIADRDNHQIRQLDPSGQVTTLAGTTQPGQRDGLASQAQFDSPSALWWQPEGILWVIEAASPQLRRVWSTETGSLSSPLPVVGRRPS
ncbi:MAG: NHL repeat-containing protein [Cyanobacteriota bacterium]|nr:NHL repeat-containing protein [Cyanobacteriota bacterium]